MDCGEVENGGGIRLFWPRQIAFVLLLNEPDRAVDQFNIVLAKVVTNLGEERSQSFTRYVDLRDDFSGWILGVFLLIYLAMVVLGIDAHLMGIRPVALAVCGEIIIRITTERLLLVVVCKIEQGPPPLIREAFLFLGHRGSW